MNDAKNWGIYDSPHVKTVKNADAEAVTLRDQFAMAALTGLLSALAYKSDANFVAKEAYIAADAMLKAREAK